jgi:hypothetical protein
VGIRVRRDGLGRVVVVGTLTAMTSGNVPPMLALAVMRLTASPPAPIIEA